MAVPKYLRVVEQIENDFIFNADYKEKQIPSIRKLLARYGVSLLTVNKSIDELKKRGCLYGEQGRGVYIQSQEKSAQGRDRVKKVVVVSRVIAGVSTQKYELDILDGVQDLCRKNQVELLHFQVEKGEQVLGKLQGEKLLEQRDCGFVLIFEDESIQNSVKSLARLKRSYVVIANDSVAPEHQLNFDLKTSINAALRDLKQQGFADFHYLGPDNPTMAFEDRRQTFVKFLKRQGLDAEERVHLIPAGDVSSRMGYKAMKPLLKKFPSMDVLFCAEDRLAMGALIHMLEKGRSCPDDIAVFGVGNNRSITEEFIPSISSIDFEGAEIGRQAYFKLVDQSDPKDVKGRYIKRESTSL